MILKSRSIFSVCMMLFAGTVSAQTIFVSTTGNDQWAGTNRRPVATIDRACQIAREYPRNKSVDIILEDGTYYLAQTQRFTAADSRDYPAKLSIRARNEGKAVISGGCVVHLKWTRQSDGIYTAPMDANLDIDQLFVNGTRQLMARYPNVRQGERYNVFDAWQLNVDDKADEQMQDALSPERTRRWKNPEGGYVHAMQNRLWGDMHWIIKGRKPDGGLELEGGWQNNRPTGMHDKYRIVENIKEELDAPGEWFYDSSERKLYYFPTEGTDMARAKVETVRLRHLIEFDGTEQQPVQGIELRGLVFVHAARTFMDNREPLLRSDWTIYRGGAVTLRGAEDCAVIGCEFSQLGGNSIFVDGYNRHLLFSGCYIHDGGANGIAFVGSPKSVNDPLFGYHQSHKSIDNRRGPITNDYPSECRVEDCLITMTGRDEKQTAPVQISMAHRITVSHCSIYDVPRAGINISEGTFGGHVIEHCDVFNTVLETSDHGSFNSWGRDRMWHPEVAVMSRMVDSRGDMYAWDMIEPNTIRDSRWRCDHGWDIDLDDGSSRYRIYNNLLLAGGLKLREGYDRVVENNVVINNSLHPHVWPANNGDRVCHNIFTEQYYPVLMNAVIAPDGRWGSIIDYNFFAASGDMARPYADNGCDLHSLCGAPMFTDAAHGDFSVADTSQALEVGFYNFPMDDFGVRSAQLRAIAKTPTIPTFVMGKMPEKISVVSAAKQQVEWLGAVWTLVTGDALSAFGVRLDQSGFTLTDIQKASAAYKAGLHKGDLLIAVDGVRVSDSESMDKCTSLKKKTVRLDIMRKQQPVTLVVTLH